jgi:hypothetical protein
VNDSAAESPLLSRQRRDSLKAGPWLWPRGEVPPSGPPGEALLVSTNQHGRAASLWALSPTRDGVHFIEDAEPLWSEALHVLPQVVPALWRPLSAARCVRPRAVWLASWAGTSGAAQMEPVLKGRSFGFAFVLSVASFVFERPLRADVAALAELGRDGVLLPVGDIDTKIRAIVECAPYVTTVLVHHSQKQSALRDARGRVRIVPIHNVRDAFTGMPDGASAFEGTLTDWLADAGLRDDSRAEVVEALVHLALTGRAHLTDWTAVVNAANVCLNWDGLTPDATIDLQFARAIAERHEANRGHFAAPPNDWISRFPLERRVLIAAHLLQQSADTGQPNAAEAIAFANQVIGRRFPPRADELSDFYLPQLKAAGALARLWAVSGRADDALTLQLALARQLLSLGYTTEVSHPLSEAFRLSGALGRHDAFDAAERVRSRAAMYGGFTSANECFVNLAKARALILLSRETDVAEPLLHTLIGNDAISVPAHVRWSAARWRVALLRRNGRHTEADNELRAITIASTGGIAHAESAALIARILCDMDALLHGVADTTQHARAAAAVNALSQAEPGIVGNLLATMAGHREPLAAVHTLAKFYPY